MFSFGLHASQKQAGCKSFSTVQFDGFTIIDWVGFSGLFFFNATIFSAFLIICYFVLPETHKLTLEDIEMLFKKDEKSLDPLLKEKENGDVVKKENCLSTEEIKPN